MNTRALRVVFWCLFASAVTGYVIQCFTPLRLNQDALNYLGLAASASKGQGFTVQGAPTISPLGYPALIWLMLKLGLGHSWCLNFVNLLGIAVGLLATRFIARARGVSGARFRIVIVACLFSFAFIKHAAIPMTDVPFFGVTLAALALAESAATMTGRRAWIRWGISLVLAIAALSLRVAGITGLLVLLFECMRAAYRRSGRGRVAVLVLLGSIAVGIVTGLAMWERRPGATTGTPVLLELAEYKRQPVLTIIGRHITEFGQVVLNIPQSKVPGGTPLTLPFGFLFLYFTAALAVIAAYGLILARSRRSLTPARIFLICYSAMIFLWPYQHGQGVDPRMWLPALPLFVVELLSKEAPLRLSASRTVRFAVYSYATCFILLGIAAFAYSGVLTISQRAFLNLEMIQQWRPEYEVWLTHKTPPGTVADPHVVSILREFGGTDSNVR